MAQRARQPQADLGAAGRLQTPGQRGSQIIVLGLQPLPPGGLPRAAQVRLGLLGQRQIVLGVPLARILQLARLAQALRDVLPDQLMQIISPAHRPSQQTLVDERR
jgi:hypothetical protein